ncbi:MAG: dihydroorotate dehydrogenase electron transfer subunit [Anaerolineae bacterium]|nr:dihydroorotate dehydrogenase electron transfer subunit [Anaerolineae bacterium]
MARRGAADGLPRPYRIAAVQVENPTIRTFVLDGAIDAAPGQFVMAWLPGIDEKPFSPSSADPIALTVERVGPFTTAMHALSPGDRVWLRGPFGRGFTPHPGALLLIGGGCGAAPLRYLAQRARAEERRVHVVLGARTAEGLFFQEQYAALGCALHVATDDGSAGRRGTAIEAAAALLDGGLSPGGVYACGPEPMLDAVYLLAHDRRLPCQLSYEAYMRCGIGVCGSCSIGGRLVCRDGPVFERPPREG